MVCSVFVNPIQFNNPADLEKYPRTPEKDIEKLQCAGCDAVFMPSAEEMYPEKVEGKVVMEPMNPYERRILHSALQGNDAVTTHSEGDEPNRHVVITLK